MLCLFSFRCNVVCDLFTAFIIVLIIVPLIAFLIALLIALLIAFLIIRLIIFLLVVMIFGVGVDFRSSVLHVSKVPYCGEDCPARPPNREAADAICVLLTVYYEEALLRNDYR